MKPEYIEGPEALKKVEFLATAILQAPSRKKKKQAKKPTSARNPK
jgi:hypothetical protein